MTGGHGMLGKALCATLAERGLTDICAPTRADLDLLDARHTQDYFTSRRPDVVFHLASVVFGLLGNMRNQVRSISESTLINHNVLTACAALDVRKVCFAGSVACYPFPYPGLPLTEDMIWQGLPHEGELGYAHAKRHGLAYLELLRKEGRTDFFYALLTNLYGPHDTFNASTGHVIPSLIFKMHQSKQTGTPFSVWGDGSARRDFMHVRDAAAALIWGTEALSGAVNVSSGVAISISDVVGALVRAAKYDGEVVWQTDQPVGVPDRSVSDAILRGVGFRCNYGLEQGISETWEWFDQHFGSTTAPMSH